MQYKILEYVKRNIQHISFKYHEQIAKPSSPSSKSAQWAHMQVGDRTQGSVTCGSAIVILVLPCTLELGILFMCIQY